MRMLRNAECYSKKEVPGSVVKTFAEKLGSIPRIHMGANV